MKHPIKPFLGACCLLGALVLGGCAAGSGAGSGSGGAGGGGAVAPGRDYFPGGSPVYAWESGQSKENFVNVERAQVEYSPYKAQRVWIDFQGTNRASASMIGLQAYYPLHVRWKLKDGREFILENIDTSAIMREYFKTHDIQMPWQREGRPKHAVGDPAPLLTHEVTDDTVRIKWVITTNRTPVNQRLTATGAATKWDFADEEFLVATLKGVPTSGIEFNKKWEFNCPGPKCVKE